MTGYCPDCGNTACICPVPTTPPPTTTDAGGAQERLAQIRSAYRAIGDAAGSGQFIAPESLLLAYAHHVGDLLALLDAAEARARRAEAALAQQWGIAHDERCGSLPAICDANPSGCLWPKPEALAAVPVQAEAEEGQQ